MLLNAMPNPPMDSPIRHLEAQGVMLSVFNQLQGLDDLVVCSSVSRTWNTLIREARPNCLTIGSEPYFRSLDGEGAACALRWLQTKQRAGHLQNLRDFCLIHQRLFRDEYEEPRLQSAFFEAAVMCTGFWNLQSCTLEGPFCLEQAVALLPTTLKQLDLTPVVAPREFYLSDLGRFVNMQLLVLAGTEEALPPSNIYLSDGSMLALRSLKVYEPFQIMMDDVAEPVEVNHDAQLSSRVYIALPRLVQLSVSICADDAGIDLANVFLNLTGLKELAMYLTKSTSRSVVLRVSQSSSLAMLRIVGPRDRSVEVSLEINKEQLEYECCRIANVFMPRSSRCLSKLQIA